VRGIQAGAPTRPSRISGVPAADRYFTGNAQLLRRLITVERALQTNSKIVIPTGSELVNVIGDIAGVLPLGRTQTEPLRVRDSRDKTIANLG